MDQFKSHLLGDAVPPSTSPVQTTPAMVTSVIPQSTEM